MAQTDAQSIAPFVILSKVTKIFWTPENLLIRNESRMTALGGE